MLRSYLHSGVDKDHANNTYIEIFMASDPKEPWILEIIDRSYFKQKELYISDYNIYMD